MILRGADAVMLSSVLRAACLSGSPASSSSEVHLIGPLAPAKCAQPHGRRKRICQCITQRISRIETRFNISMKLFQKTPDTKTVVRESKSQLNRETRSLEREVQNLRREEEKLKKVRIGSAPSAWVLATGCCPLEQFDFLL